MSLSYIFSRLDVQQIASAFVVLFAVIDVLGSTPIFISLKQQGRLVHKGDWGDALPRGKEKKKTPDV